VAVVNDRCSFQFRLKNDGTLNVSAVVTGWQDSVLFQDGSDISGSDVFVAGGAATPLQGIRGEKIHVRANTTGTHRWRGNTAFAAGSFLMETCFDCVA